MRAAEAAQPGTKAFDDALLRYRQFIDSHINSAAIVDAMFNKLAGTIMKAHPEIKTAEDLAKWLANQTDPQLVALRDFMKLFKRAEELMRHGQDMN